MITTFDKLYRQLGLITFGVLVAGLSSYGLALLCALLGFSRAVESFKSVAFSLAYVFGILFSLFLLASVVAAVIRWLDRRHQPGAQAPSAPSHGPDRNAS